MKPRADSKATIMRQREAKAGDGHLLIMQRSLLVWDAMDGWLLGIAYTLELAGQVAGHWQAVE